MHTVIPISNLPASVKHSLVGTFTEERNYYFHWYLLDVVLEDLWRLMSKIINSSEWHDCLVNQIISFKTDSVTQNIFKVFIIFEIKSLFPKYERFFSKEIVYLHILMIKCKPPISSVWDPPYWFKVYWLLYMSKRIKLTIFSSPNPIYLRVLNETYILIKFVNLFFNFQRVNVLVIKVAKFKKMNQ